MNRAAARLLIVDDESAQMRALCDTLVMEGYATHGFSSARKALAELRPGEFDLLLTDLMMPEMDGITLINAAKQMTGRNVVVKIERVEQAVLVAAVLSHHLSNLPLICLINQTIDSSAQFKSFSTE